MIRVHFAKPKVRVFLNAAKWEESKHPRDKSGRFGKGEGKTKDGKSNKYQVLVRKAKTLEAKNDPKKTSEQIEKTLDSMRVKYKKDTSGLSDSQYISFYDKEGNERKIRISDHSLPPAYRTSKGSAGDYEIGGYQDSDSSDYRDAIIYVAKTTGKELPTEYKQYQEEETQKRIERKSQIEKQKSELETFTQKNKDMSKKAESILESNNPDINKNLIDIFSHQGSSTSAKKGRKKAKESLIQNLVMHGMDKEDATSYILGLSPGQGVYEDMKNKLYRPNSIKVYHARA